MMPSKQSIPKKKVRPKSTPTPLPSNDGRDDIDTVAIDKGGESRDDNDIERAINSTGLSDKESNAKDSPPTPNNITNSYRIVVIISYACIWTCFYLLVHYYGGGDNTTTSEDTSSTIQQLRSSIFVICVEVIKLILSCVLINYRHQSRKDIIIGQRQQRGFEWTSLLIPYLPVALLYAMYNNLMFLNLQSCSPTVYLVLSSSRLVMTAIVWQKLFSSYITPMQKFALILITCGIIFKNSGASSTEQTEENLLQNHSTSGSTTRTILIILQMMCSVMAGVLNEKLLKRDGIGGGHNKNPHMQNIALYINSIGINLLVVLYLHITLFFKSYNDNQRHIGILAMLNSVMASSSSILTILTLAVAGIISSLVLRYENSITKGTMPPV